MKRSELHHTGQQLKDDFESFKKTLEFTKMSMHISSVHIYNIFKTGWWAGRVAQLNHRPIKQPA